MTQGSNKNNNDLSASAVADYLKNHVDFFENHPNVLLMMRLDDSPAGSVSLVERQMAGLRHRNQEFEKELQQAVSNAQDNQLLLQKTISLMLKLIPCEDLDSLVQTLLLQLNEVFSIKYRKVLLDQSAFDSEANFCVDIPSIRKVLGDNFPQQQAVCGRLKSAEKAVLFAETDKVNSVAILPLGEKGELGLLVLGSEDATHFDPEMGDIFLTLIADMLSRVLYRQQN